MEKTSTASKEINVDCSKVFDEVFPTVLDLVIRHFSKKRNVADSDIEEFQKIVKENSGIHLDKKRKVRIADLRAEWRETKNSFQEISSEIDDILINGSHTNFWKTKDIDGLVKMEKVIGDLDDHVCECEEKLQSFSEKYFC